MTPIRVFSATSLLLGCYQLARRESDYAASDVCREVEVPVAHGTRSLRSYCSHSASNTAPNQPWTQ